MATAKVAIIGRPNVGKSSLFNWLAGDRISVVDEVAGVTRDRVSCLLELSPEDQDSDEPPRLIELTDTGGIGIVDKDDLSEDVEQQIDMAIATADLILFVTDAREGIASLDEHVAERLRTLSVPILLVANKSDNETQEANAEEFHRFGWGVIAVSAKQKRGRSQLMDAIEKTLDPSIFTKESDDEAQGEPTMKIAIVGRRNVGKSTFVNTLVHEERVIASPIPGTTRDSVDVRFEMNGETFIAIDTPGFMRRRSIGTDLDYYSLRRAQRSIRMADVVLMFFDCSQRISRLDARR